MKKTKEYWKKLLDSGGVRKLIVLAGAIGVALIVLPGLFPADKASGAGESTYSVTDFRQSAQKELEALLSHIQGAGKTRIMLTVENSAQAVYLENGTTKTEEIQPHVRGVLVLCEGGDNPVTIGRITEAVTKALDISTAKVCVEKLTE